MTAVGQVDGPREHSSPDPCPLGCQHRFHGQTCTKPVGVTGKACGCPGPWAAA